MGEKQVLEKMAESFLRIVGIVRIGKVTRKRKKADLPGGWQVRLVKPLGGGIRVGYWPGNPPGPGIMAPPADPPWPLGMAHCMVGLTNTGA